MQMRARNALFTRTMSTASLRITVPIVFLPSTRCSCANGEVPADTPSCPTSSSTVRTSCPKSRSTRLSYFSHRVVCGFPPWWPMISTPRRNRDGGEVQVDILLRSTAKKAIAPLSARSRFRTSLTTLVSTRRITGLAPAPRNQHPHPRSGCSLAPLQTSYAAAAPVPCLDLAMFHLCPTAVRSGLLAQALDKSFTFRTKRFAMFLTRHQQG